MFHDTPALPMSMLGPTLSPQAAAVVHCNMHLQVEQNPRAQGWNQEATQVYSNHVVVMLAMQVAYISIRSWQNSTDEAKERASFSRSTQDR